RFRPARHRSARRAGFLPGFRHGSWGAARNTGGGPGHRGCCAEVRRRRVRADGTAGAGGSADSAVGPRAGPVRDTAAPGHVKTRDLPAARRSAGEPGGRAGPRRSPGPRAWTSLRGTRAEWSAGHGGGWSATSRARVRPPLHGRGLVRPFTTVGWSAPSRTRVGPPRHGRGFVRPFTDAGWSATSRTRVGPSPSGAGVGAAAAGDGRAPRALPAYPVGRAARLREGVRPGDVGEPGQPGSGSGTVRRRSRCARAARVDLTGREPAAAFLLVGPLPGGGDGVHDGAWHATTPSRLSRPRGRRAAGPVPPAAAGWCPARRPRPSRP